MRSGEWGRGVGQSQCVHVIVTCMWKLQNSKAPAVEFAGTKRGTIAVLTSHVRYCTSNSDILTHINKNCCFNIVVFVALVALLATWYHLKRGVPVR